MKTLVLYETTSGNTAFGVEIIRLALERLDHDCEIRRIKQSRPSDAVGFDFYCVATPINAFGPLTPVFKFVRKLPQLRGKPAMVFSTCAGWPAQSNAMIAKELEKKGMAVIGDHWMACPDSWPITRLLDKHVYERVRFPLISSIKKTAAFTEKAAGQAERYLQGSTAKHDEYRILPTPLYFSGLFAVTGMLGKAGLARIVDMDKCDLCGICAENCPASAIKIDTEPRFSSACIGCWGCFNVCPKNAVISRIAGPEYYHKGISDKDKLLREAGIE